MRWLPMVAIAEVKGTMAQADPHHAPEGSHEHEAKVDPSAGGLVPEGAE
jgi:hypothetical protein